MALSVPVLIVVLYVLVPLSNDNRCPECGGLFLAHVNSLIGAAHFKRTCGAFALQFEKDLAILLRA